MKKIIIAFIISLFSIHSFAANVLDRNAMMMAKIMTDEQLMNQVTSQVADKGQNETFELRSIAWTGTSGGTLYGKMNDQYLMTFDNFGHTAYFPLVKCQVIVSLTTLLSTNQTTSSITSISCQ
jgi:hypothetical protein